MKILVIGGSGFLGSHVADELSERGHEVTIFDSIKSEYISSKQNRIRCWSIDGRIYRLPPSKGR